MLRTPSAKETKDWHKSKIVLPWRRLLSHGWRIAGSIRYPQSPWKRHWHLRAALPGGLMPTKRMFVMSHKDPKSSEDFPVGDTLQGQARFKSLQPEEAWERTRHGAAALLSHTRTLMLPWLRCSRWSAYSLLVPLPGRAAEQAKSWKYWTTKNVIISRLSLINTAIT